MPATDDEAGAPCVQQHSVRNFFEIRCMVALAHGCLVLSKTLIVIIQLLLLLMVFIVQLAKKPWGRCNNKMAIILPTGQWYAPSAVINDTWYCIVLHGIALYYMVLHYIAWY